MESSVRGFKGFISFTGFRLLWASSLGPFSRGKKGRTFSSIADSYNQKNINFSPESKVPPTGEGFRERHERYKI